MSKTLYISPLDGTVVKTDGKDISINKHVELMTRKQRKQKAKREGKKFIPINGYEGSKDDGWYND